FYPWYWREPAQAGACATANKARERPLAKPFKRIPHATMTSIFEMIKRNAVPATVMRTAANGALPVPADQMLEILVYLTQNPVFAQDARMTLAGFDLDATLQIAANPQSAPAVLGYYWSEENRRPALMPALIENP